MGLCNGGAGEVSRGRNSFLGPAQPWDGGPWRDLMVEGEERSDLCGRQAGRERLEQGEPPGSCGGAPSTQNGAVGMEGQ